MTTQKTNDEIIEEFEKTYLLGKTLQEFVDILREQNWKGTDLEIFCEYIGEVFKKALEAKDQEHKKALAEKEKEIEIKLLKEFQRQHNNEKVCSACMATLKSIKDNL